MTPLAHAALDIARSTLGVRELKRNRGPEIDEWIWEGGGLNPEGAPPYCASWVNWCVLQAARRITGEGFTGPLQWRLGPAASVYKLYARNSTLEIGAAEPGCVFLDFHTASTGHCGFVVEVMPDGRLRTLEANTGPGPAAPAEDRDGQGVYERFDRRIEQVEKWLRVA